MSEKFTVKVDTREQKPFLFRGVKTVVGKLDTGDYSIPGYENRVCIERKSLDDFVQSVTTQWPRFRNELTRMKEFEFKHIVAEFSPEDIIQKKYYAHTIDPSRIFGQIMDIHVNFGITICFTGSRRAGARMTLGLLRMWWLKEIEK